MRKAILIYNPLSGNRNVPRKLDYIIERFMENDIMLQPYRICNNEQDKLLGILKEEDYFAAVISGGDGTINLVINAMLKDGINIPLGIIPSGTCNDFARSLNIPVDLKRCLDVILSGSTSDIDIGLINNEKYFFNTCAGGVFVDVSYNTSSELKRNLGPLAYYLKGASEVANARPLRLKIQTDTEVLDQDFLLFVILNGKHAAGFSNINEAADLSDGLMDIILVKYCQNIDLVGMFFKALSKDLLSDRNIVWVKTRKCIIEGPGDFALSVDGEKWNGLPISVDFLNKKIKVFKNGLL